MKSWLNKDRLLAGTIIAGASVFGLAGPAVAQDTEDEIIVTGSRIPQPNLVSTSPVTQIGSDEVGLRGVTRIEDMVNTLPQAFAVQGSAISNGATGTANVSLRGLGSARTLVLVDGRRLPYGSPLGQSAADLNQIPATLVDRVEVLTGGASAVYGSDAIAGVVNFIMRDDFEGVRVDLNYSWYQHQNDDDIVAPLVDALSANNPAEFSLPEENVMDGWTWDTTLVMGVNSEDGRGNITVYAGWRHVDPVYQGDRDYSSCALGTAGGNFVCAGSGTSAGGQFTDFATFAYTLDTANPGEFRNYVGATDAFNFNPYNFYQRPDERYALGAFAHYELNPHAEVYAQLMFHDDRSNSQIAPSGNFFGTSTLNCGNPLLSAGQAADIGCSAGDIAADNPVTVYIGRRNVEGGGRQDDIRHTSYRVVTGIRGELNQDWAYDLSAQYGAVQLSRVYRNDFSITRLGRALDVVDVAGTPTCRSVVNGTDPNCVPYNIFTPGGVTQAALDYLQVPLHAQGETKQQVVLATITGDFGSMGGRSPWAEDPIAVAFGVEYRRDELTLEVDSNFQSGDGAGQGGPTPNQFGVVDAFEVFAETRIPVAQDQPFFEMLTVDAAFRYSDYNTGQQTETYKFGADWAPVEDIRFRGSFQAASRAANISELFFPSTIGLFTMTTQANGSFDPCSGAVPQATLAQCQNSGVSAGQYGAIADNIAGQFNALFGGNPNLEPEESETITYGVVFTPSFLPGFSVSVDYFNITVEKFIGTVPPATALNNCVFSGDPFFCSLIQRNPVNGTLWVGNNAFVVATNVNTGSVETTGIDVVADYSLDFGGIGGFNFNFVGTYLDELIVEDLPGDIPRECAGWYGPLCGTPIGQTPNPEWRHKLRVTWETPLPGLQLSGSWRYMSAVDLCGAITAGQCVNTGGGGVPQNLTIDEQHYFDVAGSWAIRDNITFRLGVNNVFDEDPPLTSIAGPPFGNGNTYPQVYDALGQYVFMGLTADF